MALGLTAGLVDVRTARAVGRELGAHRRPVNGGKDIEETIRERIHFVRPDAGTRAVLAAVVVLVVPGGKRVALVLFGCALRGARRSLSAVQRAVVALLALAV